MSGLIRHLSVLQSHVFLLNSRLGLFTAASLLSLEEAPLLPKLQGNFAEFLGRDSLERLRILSSTTCVGLRYGRLQNTTCSSFSWQSAPDHYLRWPKPWSTITLSAKPADLPTSPLPTGFNQHFRPLGCRLLLRPCITFMSRYGNINPLAIGYAYRLHLRSRLTLIRLALIRNPGSYGELVSHQFYRYLCLHLLFSPVHPRLPRRLHPRRECSPTRHTLHSV